MLKIQNTREVHAVLHTSTETNVPHYGLITTAFYKLEGIPFMYRIVWYNRHAPVKIDADIVTVRIADDAPMIWLDIDGRPLREKGAFICARQLVVFCPKFKDAESNAFVYYKGYSPFELATKIINERLVPCVWGDRSGGVR